MKRLQIITTISLIALLLMSAFFVYNKHTDIFDFKSESFYDNAGPEVKSNADVKYENVIMGAMGNKTEKYMSLN
jgi:hypothetical protein